MNTACQSFVPLLSPFIDGELSPGERVGVERHLAACKDCTMRAADLRAESGLLRVGMDMLADDVDFKDFSQKVMARIGPEKPPLFERLRVSLSETFRYQRGMMLGAAAAAVIGVLAVPLLLRGGPATGYANERMQVQTVSVDESANVAPVVMETEGGDAIIWMIEQGEARPKDAAEDDEAKSEELEVESGGSDKAKEPPKGGEL